MSNQRRNQRKVWHKLFQWMRERNNGVLDLQGTDLRGADLQGTDLRDADLWDANLRNADLRDANLRNADLRGTDLRDADLRNASITTPTGMTSMVADVVHVVGTNKYGVGCYTGEVDEFIAKTIDVRSPQQAKQIFHRCLSFGVEEHEQAFLDAITKISRQVKS